MRIPDRLATLIEYGVIDAVVRPLLSGKEAQVYLVESGGELRAAKVYKARDQRSFRNKSSYTEERKVRNSRDRRAMNKRGSKYGRQRDEEIWNSVEADIIRSLYDAGVRVPTPHAFIDGVLVMECIEGPDGGPAPRLADCVFGREEAQRVFDQIMAEVAAMLSADIVHADLSVYNILFDGEGPVLIDFPQSIIASQNRRARDILLRDIANITSRFRLGRTREQLRFGHEMWDLYENGELRSDTQLTGMFDLPEHEVDAELLLEELLALEEDQVLAFDEDGGSLDDLFG